MSNITDWLTYFVCLWRFLLRWTRHTLLLDWKKAKHGLSTASKVKVLKNSHCERWFLGFLNVLSDDGIAVFAMHWSNAKTVVKSSKCTCVIACVIDRVMSWNWYAGWMTTGMKHALVHDKALFLLSMLKRRVNRKHLWWRPCRPERPHPYWVRSIFIH